MAAGTQKAMGRLEMSPEELYQPAIQGRHDMVIYDHNAPAEELSEALAMGRIIVSEGFGTFVEEAHGLEVYPDKSIEPRRSAHGVTFGRLLGAHKYGIETGRLRRRQSLPVAIKPFSTPEDAVNEMRGYRTLQELEIPTFEPIGLFPAALGSHVISLTLKDSGLLSLDRSPWIIGRQITSEQSMAIAEHNNTQIKGIAETMALIHANGVFAPDGQIKNWAGDARGRIGAIDPEGQIVRPLGDESASDLAWEDVEHLITSLVIDNLDSEDGKTYGVGMLAHLPLHVVRSSIEELLIHPYMARLEGLLNDDIDPNMAIQIENLYDGIAEKFYNDEHWPEHLIAAN
jgi:hypothetical protein